MTNHSIFVLSLYLSLYIIGTASLAIVAIATDKIEESANSTAEGSGTHESK